MNKRQLNDEKKLIKYLKESDAKPNSRPNKDVCKKPSSGRKPLHRPDNRSDS